jgi:hypothetical protein
VVAVGAFVLVAIPQDITIPGGVSAAVLAVVGAVSALAWYLLRQDRAHIAKQLDSLTARVTTLETRTAGTPDGTEYEKRLRKEKHDTLEVVRKEYLRPTTDAIDKLDQRLDRLEAKGRTA